MGVFIRRTKKGIYPFWIGFWQEDGARHETTIIRWRGTPPDPGESEGDNEFERSRAEAESLFKRIREKGRGKAEEVALVQKIHAARYGARVARVKISELEARWDALPHKADLTQGRRKRVHSVLRRFETFMRKRFPRISDVGALTPEHFKAFFEDVDKHGIPEEKDTSNTEKGVETDVKDEEEEGGVSARTWNDVLSILRGLLQKVDGQSEGYREYLANLPKRDEITVHRRPFSTAELDAIFAAAAEVDPELRPVIVADACTALRRGDVARLKWKAIDMVDGFATVKTTKTGETVEIPIFPPFMAVLREAEQKRKKGEDYVFPTVAKAYETSPDSLDRRLRKVLEAAGFVTPNIIDAAKYPAPSSPAEAVAVVDAGMRRDKWTAKRREKGLAILQKHLEGQNGRTIAAGLGIARGAVSSYLHAMEDAGKIALVTPPKPDEDSLRKVVVSEMRDGEQRKRRGSLCGWHSFRTTFCSLALANGVPMEILRRITGHRTAEIVEKHYNQAKREQARRAFRNAMPKAIVGAARPALPPEDGEEMVALPADLAGLLSGASAADLKKVKALLKKGSKA